MEPAARRRPVRRLQHHRRQRPVHVQYSAAGRVLRHDRRCSGGARATADSGSTGAGPNAASEDRRHHRGRGTGLRGRRLRLSAGASTAVIGDRVWSDANGDGVQDAGEVGIGGVTVQLKQGATRPCDHGHRCRRQLPVHQRGPGPLRRASVTPPLGYTRRAIRMRLVRVRAATTPTRTWRSGGSRVGRIRLRLQCSNANGSIGDTIYRSDTNARHRRRHRLTFTPQAPTTARHPRRRAGGQHRPPTPDRLYHFTGLPAGIYHVVVTDVNVAWTGLQAAVAGRVGHHHVPACTMVTDQDFGYAPLSTTGSGTIGDTVYFDSDGSGSQAASGEPGIPGVTVEALERCAAPRCWRPRSTDANGNYSFTGLAAGSYRVRVATSTRDQGSVLYGLTPTQTESGPFAITCLGQHLHDRQQTPTSATRRPPAAPARSAARSGTTRSTRNGTLRNRRAGAPGRDGRAVAGRERQRHDRAGHRQPGAHHADQRERRLPVPRLPAGQLHRAR